MSAKRIILVGIWGIAALCSLFYGIVYRSANALMLFVASGIFLVSFVCWIIDCAALERRIARLEARSEIADERRVGIQTDLAGVGHRLEEVEAELNVPGKSLP